MENSISLQHYDSPCGRLVLASFADRLCLCDWSDNPFAERNRRRIEKYLKATSKTETTSVLEDNSTNTLQASARLSTYSYVWLVLIFSIKCGTHCEAFRTDRQRAIRI